MLQICGDEHMPKRQTVYDWLERVEGLSGQFARAREAGCDAIAEESLAIMDREPLAVFDEAGNKRYDPGSISWNKGRAEHRLKLLACWNPQKYGSKVAVGGDLTTADLREASRVAHTGVPVEGSGDPRRRGAGASARRA